MKQKRLRTAVAGLGRIGWQYHLPEVVSNPNFELVAVADPVPERLREAEREFQAPQCFASCEAMIEAVKPDLLVLTTPTFLHAAQTVFAFEHGVDVFCEKPLANSLVEAEMMAAAMHRCGRKLMVYQPHRVRPEVAALRGILASGRLGRIFLVRRCCGAYSRRNDWQSKLELGGGMLNNYGAHFIDQFMHVFGGAPFAVSGCELRRVASLGDADDVVKILLRNAAGVVGDIDINMASGFPINVWEVFGEYGTAVMEAPSQQWRVRYLEPAELPPLTLQNTLAAAGRAYASEKALPWHEETVPFVTCEPSLYYRYAYEYFGLDRPPFAPIEMTLELMRINAECRRLASGRMDAF